MYIHNTTQVFAWPAKPAETEHRPKGGHRLIRLQEQKTKLALIDTNYCLCRGGGFPNTFVKLHMGLILTVLSAHMAWGMGMHSLGYAWAGTGSLIV